MFFITGKLSTNENTKRSRLSTSKTSKCFKLYNKESSCQISADLLLSFHIYFVSSIPVYNGPSVATRPFVCALVALFLYILLKEVVAFFYVELMYFNM